MPTGLASILGAIGLQKSVTKPGIPASLVLSQTSSTEISLRIDKRLNRLEVTALLTSFFTRETLSDIAPKRILIGVKRGSEICDEKGRYNARTLTATSRPASLRCNDFANSDAFQGQGQFKDMKKWSPESATQSFSPKIEKDELFNPGRK
jgi:hypothetical protein